jgi:hypothetical protein
LHRERNGIGLAPVRRENIIGYRQDNISAR